MKKEPKNKEWPRRFYDKFQITDDEMYDFIEELLAQKEAEAREELFQEHLQVLEESKKMSYQQGWIQGQADQKQKLLKKLPKKKTFKPSRIDEMDKEIGFNSCLETIREIIKEL